MSKSNYYAKIEPGDRVMSQTLELPDAIYNALVQTAQENATTPIDWIAKSLPAWKFPRTIEREPTDEEIEEANARLERHVVYLPNAVGSDNASIDADLAHEYGSDHADLYPGLRDA
jgi:hypothetical protein